MKHQHRNSYCAEKCGTRKGTEKKNINKNYRDASLQNRLKLMS